MKREGGQDGNHEPYDQVVKMGEGWVDLEPVLLTICWVGVVKFGTSAPYHLLGRGG